MRVMVVGGAGFIGSHLTERLLAEGYAVDVVDVLSSGSLANLAEARAFGGDLTIHTLDASADDFQALVARRRPDVIYNLAVLPPGTSADVAVSESLLTTMAVLQAAKTNGNAKLVMAFAAVALYGEVAAKDLPVKESQPWNPISLNGILTRTIADLLTLHREQHAIEFTALALATVYGSRQRPSGGVVANFAKALSEDTLPVVHGTGKQTRDFLFVDDAVDALVRAATKGSGLVVNVGTGVATSIGALWSLMAEADGRKPVPQPTIGPARSYDVARFALSPTRARLHLGWAPWTELAMGVRSVLAAG